MEQIIQNATERTEKILVKIKQKNATDVKK